MQLDPRQLSSLHEMGIPVWELRQGQESEQVTIVDVETEDPETATVAIISQQQLINSRCFVVVDSANHNEQIQKLLAAILFAIALPLEQITVIGAEQLAQLMPLNEPEKLLIIMGSDLQIASSEPLFNIDQAHQIIGSNISILRSLSLVSLLSKPSNKATVWHDLQLAKAFFS